MAKIQSYNPFASNNGLRVIGRTSGSISLSWGLSLEIEEDSEGTATPSPADENLKNEGSEDDEEEPKEPEPVERDGNWYHIEMKRGEGSSARWESIYKGYKTNFVIDGLPPDSVMVFRMKQNFDEEWGTEVVASTETAPASVEDLNRAVEIHSDYLVSRILDLTRPSHLKKILHAHDRNGMTTLMVASMMGNVAVTEKLLSLGSDINAVSNGTLRTPLMFACIAGRHNIAVILDKHGANWKVRDKCGCMPLDYAINCDHLPLVKLAYSKLGFSYLNQKDLTGWTPLLRASVYTLHHELILLKAIVSDNLEVLKFLVKKGADINYSDTKDGKSPLMAAILAKKPKFVQFLLVNGADLFHENLNGVSCEEVARGLQYREITELIVKYKELLLKSNRSSSN